MWTGGDPLALIETFGETVTTPRNAPHEEVKGLMRHLKKLVGQMGDICNRVNKNKNMIADLKEKSSVAAEETHRSEFRL